MWPVKSTEAEIMSCRCGGDCIKRTANNTIELCAAEINRRASVPELIRVMALKRSDMQITHGQEAALVDYAEAISKHMTEGVE